MTREVRAGRVRKGLVLANGGVATYQHAVVLSNEPRGSAYPEKNPLPDVISDVEVPELVAAIEGEEAAVVETYTVDYNRKNQPVRGHVVGRLKESGKRFIANHGDETTLRQLGSFTKEPIGRIGLVKPDQSRKGRNLFMFTDFGKL